MTIRRPEPFLRQYEKLPVPIRKKVDRQLQQLAQDFRHPSLRAKKVSGYEDTWEGRVDIHYRFTFKTVENMIVLRRVGLHDILKHP